MTVKTSVSLTDEQDAYARALVEKGRYASVSAVLQRGLEMLRRENETHEAEIQGLQMLIDRRRTEAIVPMEDCAGDFLAAMPPPSPLSINKVAGETTGLTNRHSPERNQKTVPP